MCKNYLQAFGMNRSFGKNIEIIIHVLFWLFIFSAVNVDWTSNWFDKTIRPKTPSPLSVLLFPLIFYAHAIWAIPIFLNRRKWKIYLLTFLLIFILPEIIRSGILSLVEAETSFWQEISSRDSLLLGSPNVFWMALTFSFGYRFTKDWFIKQNQGEQLANQLSKDLKSKQPAIQPLPTEEAALLRQKLEATLRLKKVYLNRQLSLSELATQINTTDKKLSTLLNQNLQSNFYDYINYFRIEAFKKSVTEGALEHYSIAGLAHKCGFKSKSSFYRAFKKETGMSPSQFIQ